MVRVALKIVLALFLLAPSLGAAAELQIPATILRAIDGDTIEVEAQLWTDTYKRTVIRVRGLDTPEIRGKCQAERDGAQAAKAFVAAQAPAVQLTEIAPDKYGGRYDARVRLADGRDLAAVMVAQGLGRAYSGGRRDGWC